MSKISINGQYFDAEDAKISVKDRGFRFGDGVFETIKFKNNELQHIEKHLKRLKEGLDAIDIKFDIVDIPKLALKLLRENNHAKEGDISVARIAITRGQGSRGYLPTNQTPPNVVIETMLQPQMNIDKVKLCVAPYKKIPPECIPSNYKLMQGLNYTLAKKYAKENGFFDAIMLTIDGFIAECSSSNIFWEKGGKLYTPSLETGCLKGVMREVVIEENKGKVTEGKFTLDDLKAADKIFITNTVIEKLEVEEVG